MVGGVPNIRCVRVCWCCWSPWLGFCCSAAVPGGNIVEALVAQTVAAMDNGAGAAGVGVGVGAGAGSGAGAGGGAGPKKKLSLAEYRRLKKSS